MKALLIPSQVAKASPTATIDPTQPIAIDWPDTEMRVIQMTVEDYLTVSTPNEVSSSITMFWATPDQSTVVVAAARETTDARWEVRVSGAAQRISTPYASAPHKFLLGVRGDGQLAVIAAGQVSLGLKVNTSASWLLGGLVDNSVNNDFSGYGKSTIVTDAATMDVQLPAIILNALTLADFCGNVISTRPAQPADEWPLISWSEPNTLEVSGVDNQTAAWKQASIDAGQVSGVAESAHDTITIDWPASEIRGIQFDVSVWGVVDNSSGEERGLVSLLGSAGDLASVNQAQAFLSFDGTDTELLSNFYQQVEPPVVLSGRVSKAFFGISGDKKIWYIAGGQYGQRVDNSLNPQPYGHNEITRAALIGSNTYYTPATTTIVSKAADMDVVIPDMSSDGILKVCDLAGNEI